MEVHVGAHDHRDETCKHTQPQKNYVLPISVPQRKGKKMGSLKMIRCSISASQMKILPFHDDTNFVMTLSQFTQAKGKHA